MAANEFGTLQQGINDLFEGLQKKKTNEANYAKEQKKQAAQLNLGQEVLSSNQGSTTRGRLIGKSLQAGLLTPNEAITALENTDPFKFYLDIQSKAFESQDPQLMKAATVAGNIYENSLFRKFVKQSYGQAYGTLQAKKEFGVLNKGEGSSSGVEDINRTGRKSLNIPMRGFSADLNNYFYEHPDGKAALQKVQELNPNLNPTSPNFLASLHQIDKPTYTKIYAAIHDKVKNYALQQNPLLNVNAVNKSADEYIGVAETEGLGALQKTRSENGTVAISPYDLTVELDNPDYLSALSYNQGRIVRTKKKGKLESTTIFPTNTSATPNPPLPPPTTGEKIKGAVGGAVKSIFNQQPQIVTPSQEALQNHPLMKEFK